MPYTYKHVGPGMRRPRRHTRKARNKKERRQQRHLEERDFQHRLEPILEITLDQLYSGCPVCNRVARGEVPFVLKGAMGHWDLSKFNLDYLKQRFGQKMVD